MKMYKFFPKENLSKLAEGLFEAGFEIESIKTMFGYSLDFNGVELEIIRIARKKNIPGNIDSMSRLREAVFSANYEINALEILYSRWFKRFIRAKLRITQEKLD